MSKLLLVAVASLLPVEEIDCESDPQAGVKYMWSFGYQWRGAGAKTHFFYSYWDRGEQLPLFYRGTDFTMDDLFSFNGIIPQYEWECLGERKLVGPMNTRVKGYPYEESHNFGPYGLSFANDRWEEVQEPRDLVIVSDIIVNVQTGTGNRIEFWDRHGTPFKSKGRIRRFIDVGRLTKGR